MLKEYSPSPRLSRFVSCYWALAELLKDYAGRYSIELVPFNGEDYYPVPGQMSFINKNNRRFGDIILNINIDGQATMRAKQQYRFMVSRMISAELC